MLHLVNKAARAISSTAALYPIHHIIIAALLASVAYLSVVDQYMSAFRRLNFSSQVNYYHPPGENDLLEWKVIENPVAYPEAKHVSALSLRFKGLHIHQAPELNNTFKGANNERILVTKSDDIYSTLESISQLNIDGITWKVRSTDRVSKYYDSFREAFTRVKALIQGAESFDVELITIAYIAMWYTFIKLFLDMRSANSRFLLAFSTLTSSTFAFLFALVTTSKFLRIQVSLKSISEGIPFLVAIVGFKHKVSIARGVLFRSLSKADAKTIVTDTIASHSISLLRDNLVVIGALLTCVVYAPHLEGLMNFCILSSLIFAYDLILVYTFWAAILTLKVEITRARRTESLRVALEEEGLSSVVARNLASRSASDAHAYEYSIFDNYPISLASMKVATLALFFGLHAFWFGSSWLYNDDDAFANQTKEYGLSKAIAKHIPIGAKGTVVTIIAPKTYSPLGFFVRTEDFILSCLENVSTAITDKIISKGLLLAFVISIFINAYLLNASRHQTLATNKLIENEIAKPSYSRTRNSIFKTTVPFGSPEPKEREDSKVGQSEQETSSDGELEITVSPTILPLEECVKYLNEGKVKELNDSEVASLVVGGKVPLYALEKQLADNARAVVVRRKAIAKLANASILETELLPHANYDYNRVFGACCENVIGYMPLPVGIAGPLVIDAKSYHIPMATTEGCLVASTMRGCKAINAGGGAHTVLVQDGMTRGPCISFPSLQRAGACKVWLDSDEGQKLVKNAFNSTSRFARLQHVQTTMAGTLLFIRFRTTTGDAMGMNMISKGVEHSLKYMKENCQWDDMEVVSVSGNYCTDKKPAAINWIEGRGKSVVAEARIPAAIVEKILKSDVDALVELNVSKNLVGSAMAGSVGGFNAHAANLVTAVFLACGQDPAQNVESSNCITLMSKVDDDLKISVSMPSIEVGTIGGGTILEPQSAMLQMLGVKGPHPTNPGENARQLARIIASSVLAAELSLCSALAAGHLVQSHMQHNRKVDTEKASKQNGSHDIKRLQQGSVNCIRS